MSYDVTIIAFSVGGQKTNPTVYFDLIEVNAKFYSKTLTFHIDTTFSNCISTFCNYFQSLSVQYNRLIIAIFILSPFVILLIVSFIFVMIRNRRDRQIFSKDIHFRKLIHMHNKDELEMEPANVELYEILGEGAFGIVRRGLLKPTNKAIAVKMLKGNNENIKYEMIGFFFSSIFMSLFRKCWH